MTDDGDEKSEREHRTERSDQTAEAEPAKREDRAGPDADGPDAYGQGADGADRSFVFPVDEPTPPEDAPLAELAEELQQRRARVRSFDDGFESVDVDEIDTEALWERVLSKDAAPIDPGEQDVRVVRKRSYCERCQYFSSPPRVSCDHEGTEIVELVGTERFKVVNCPIVRENERLGRPLE